MAIALPFQTRVVAQFVIGALARRLEPKLPRTESMAFISMTRARLRLVYLVTISKMFSTMPRVQC